MTPSHIKIVYSQLESRTFERTPMHIQLWEYVAVNYHPHDNYCAALEKLSYLRDEVREFRWVTEWQLVSLGVA